MTLKNKKSEITTDELAMMVKKGFDSMDEQFKQRFEQMDERFEQMDERFERMDERFEQVDGKLNSLERGQEDIKAQLSNVAYRFELVELQKRVEILERRTA